MARLSGFMIFKKRLWFLRIASHVNFLRQNINNVDIMRYSMKSFLEYVETRADVDGQILEEAKKRKKKWIQKAVKHPGRCAEMGSEDCPEGSPQYNLAMRFKSGEFHHKTKNKKKD